MLAVACTSQHERAARERQSEIDALRLPAVALPTQPSPRPAIRIAVTSSSIDVDNVEVVASWPREKLEAFRSTLDPHDARSVPLIEHDVVKLSSGALTGTDALQNWPSMRQLSLVLEAAMELENRYDSAQHQQSAPRVVVHAEGQVPYDTVARVIAAAEQSHAVIVAFVVRAPGARVEVPLRAKRERSLTFGAVVPRLTVLEQGVRPCFFWTHRRMVHHR